MNYKIKLKWLSLFIPIIFSFIFNGCTPQRNLIYLQNKAISSYDSTNKNNDHYLIKTNDNIFIQITSLSKNNFELTNSTVENNLNPFYLSYTVDESGNIELPMIGPITVRGFTADSAKEKIKEALKEYVSNATVNLKIANFKLTVLGEVNKPGTYYITENRINIFEALGQGNDLTRYGNRHRVMVLRENDKGQKSTYYVDLTDKRLIYSDKYYIMHNDVIYVEPNRIAKTTGFVEIPWAIIISTISTTVLLISYIKK